MRGRRQAGTGASASAPGRRDLLGASYRLRSCMSCVCMYVCMYMCSIYRPATKMSTPYAGIPTASKAPAPAPTSPRALALAGAPGSTVAAQVRTAGTAGTGHQHNEQQCPRGRSAAPSPCWAAPPRESRREPSLCRTRFVSAGLSAGLSAGAGEAVACTCACSRGPGQTRPCLIARQRTRGVSARTADAAVHLHCRAPLPGRCCARTGRRLQGREPRLATVLTWSCVPRQCGTR